MPLSRLDGGLALGVMQYRTFSARRCLFTVCLTSSTYTYPILVHNSITSFNGSTQVTTGQPWCFYAPNTRPSGTTGSRCTVTYFTIQRAPDPEIIRKTSNILRSPDHLQP